MPTDVTCQPQDRHSCERVMALIRFASSITKHRRIPGRLSTPAPDRQLPSSRCASWHRALPLWRARQASPLSRCRIRGGGAA
eukprot:scaffold185200_cov35-Tisochrysis_lutea.AAC.1